MLTDSTVLRASLAGWESTGDPDLVRQWETVRIEDGAKLLDSVGKPLFTVGSSHV
jgi:hypothetical protein